MDILNQRIHPGSSKRTREENQKNFHDRLGKRIAVFPIYTIPEIPSKIKNMINEHVQNSVRETGFFEIIIDEEKLEKFWEKDGQLRQLKEIYLDTFYVVSVSDMDIAHPMGKYLGVDNFLLFQINDWPCENCLSQDLLRMKYRLVETRTGDIIWIGIDEKYGLNPQNKNLEELSLSMADKLTESFYDRFKEKWHQKRYKNLSLKSIW